MASLCVVDMIVSCRHGYVIWHGTYVTTDDILSQWADLSKNQEQEADLIVFARAWGYHDRVCASYKLVPVITSCRFSVSVSEYFNPASSTHIQAFKLHEQYSSRNHCWPRPLTNISFVVQIPKNQYGLPTRLDSPKGPKSKVYCYASATASSGKIGFYIFGWASNCTEWSNVYSSLVDVSSYIVVAVQSQLYAHRRQ